MKHDINRFNTSDYSIDNSYDIPLTNKKVTGLMTRTTVSSLLNSSRLERKYALRGKKDKKKAKDIKSNVMTKSIMFEDYTR